MKDNIDVKGLKSCFGSLSMPVEPKVSAPVVKSLMASGGCLIGKTNMTEFGAKASSDSPLSGITSNPRNLNYTTGGSSAGAAASVAAGVTSFAIATDGEVPQEYQLHSADWWASNQLLDWYLFTHRRSWVIYFT